MTWILTAHGHQVNMREPRPAQMVMADIAHHLSLINRFCGATSRPYSVAEHSLLVAEIAERELGLDVHGTMAALMHDAHEAWVGDVSTPLKTEIGMAWTNVEIRFERAVQSAFALHTAADRYRSAIKRADLMALATERRDLLPADTTPWAGLAGIEPVGWVDLDTPDRASFSWRDWRQAFIDRSDELDFARQLRTQRAIA